MKEITAIIRMDMVGKTRDALSKAGFPAFTCRKVLGRGKGKVQFVVSNGINPLEIQDKAFAEQISENFRLIPKRMFVVVVKDKDLEKVIDIFMDVNSKGKPGDGKIFVTDVIDAVRVRTGERMEIAI